MAAAMLRQQGAMREVRFGNGGGRRNEGDVERLVMTQESDL